MSASGILFHDQYRAIPAELERLRSAFVPEPDQNAKFSTALKYESQWSAVGRCCRALADQSDKCIRKPWLSLSKALAVLMH
ncbi:MAG: hypothetical protein U1E04_17435 [Hylemonella sp.]|nr:hypothetical protein [Hylemonella sp.]